MKKNIKELLTYEIFQDQEIFYLSIPVNNLITPKFLIKNKHLFIFLYNYSQCYIVKNLPLDLLKSIVDKKCFLTENLNQEKLLKHHILLT